MNRPKLKKCENNMKINRKISLKGLLDGKKTADNEVINDLPSQATFIEQKKLEPSTPKSTFGLLGFEGDSGSLVDRILKSQEIGELEVIKKVLDEERGTIQIPTRTDGGVQTKVMDVGHEFTSTFNQTQLSKMSAEEKQELQRIMERLGNPNELLPVHQLTDDSVRDPQGQKNPQQVVQGATGIRKIVDDINFKISSKLGSMSKGGLGMDKAKAVAGVKSKIPTGTKSTGTKDAPIPESAKEIASSIDLDNPFSASIGQF